MSVSANICKQPVVAIVGHIDHGKTTLLDYIRKSAVAEREAGGITQRVSAYEIVHKGAEGERAITFIDTPGHEAFQKMRERAGVAADIAVLIVASDDGVKPQTIEAYKAITTANIPYIVAFTKVDKENINIEKAKESVAKEGIYLEGLGGDIPYAAVSGKSGAGVLELLDLIVLAADLHNVSCDTSAPTEGVILESTRDSKIGISATVIIKRGTLATGGFAVSGEGYASLRAIEDFAGAKVATLACNKPARITGWSAEPKVGALFSVVKTKKEAEELAEKNKKPSPGNERKVVEEKSDEKVSIRVILKADSAGSLEALEYELAKIQEDRVEIIIAAKSVGPISENDVKPLIGFSPAIVLGFNVKAETAAKDLAERQHIALETRPIIYELVDWIKTEAKRLQPQVFADAVTGTAQIIRHFSTSGSKHVVGGKVTQGVLKLQDRVIIERRGIEVGPGRIVNLQMQKSDVSAVPEGMEFGAQIETKADVVTGDLVVATHKGARA